MYNQSKEAISFVQVVILPIQVVSLYKLSAYTSGQSIYASGQSIENCQIIQVVSLPTFKWSNYRSSHPTRTLSLSIQVVCLCASGQSFQVVDENESG